MKCTVCHHNQTICDLEAALINTAPSKKKVSEEMIRQFNQQGTKTMKCTVCKTNKSNNDFPIKIEDGVYKIRKTCLSCRSTAPHQEWEEISVKETRTCQTCGKDDTIDQFGVGGNIRLLNQCKECRRVKAREYYRNNREGYYKSQRKWNKNNRKAVREINRRCVANGRGQDLIWRQWRSAKVYACTIKKANGEEAAVEYLIKRAKEIIKLDSEQEKPSKFIKGPVDYVAKNSKT